MAEKILHLTLKKKWFDMIAYGEKPEEYREIKPYWITRLIDLSCVNLIDDQAVYNEFKEDIKQPLNNHDSLEDMMDYFNTKFKEYTHVIFTNGSAKNAPKMKVEFKGVNIGIGNTDWGAPDYNVFKIKLGNIIHSKHP